VFRFSRQIIDFAASAYKTTRTAMEFRTGASRLRGRRARRFANARGGTCMQRLWVVLTLAPLLCASAAADEAILLDGRRLAGTLQLDSGNRLLFKPATPGPTLPLDQLHQVRLLDGAAPPCLGGTVHHVDLADGQRLTGELLDLDAKELRLRTPWAATVALSRQVVRAITQPRGFLTFLEEDFEGGLGAWKLTGAPRLDERQHVSGKHSLLLDRPGQAAAFVLAQPLPAGRAALCFFDSGKEGGAPWHVDFQFGRAGTPSLLTVAATDTTYEMQPRGATRLPRRGGWHGLVVEFGPERVLVTVDDQVLWSGRFAHAGLALNGVRLRCGARPDQATGAVWFDDFTLARPVPDLRREDADPRQDEVWLDSGDQLLGTVVRADRHRVELEARFGKRTLPWGTVRGLFLRQGKEPAAKAGAGLVRVWLRAARGTQADQLVGQVRGLSDSRLTLRHALLGEVSIERTWLRRIAAAE
jgi:hypothetical protein